MTFTWTLGAPPLLTVDSLTLASSAAVILLACSVLCVLLHLSTRRGPPVGRA